MASKKTRKGFEVGSKYTRITACRCCGSTKLKEYLDLTDQPLANSYHKEGETLPTFPLAAMYCPKCSHSQLSIVVDPDAMFKHYLYVSGTSQTLREYFEFFAEFTRDIYSSIHGVLPENVLDIACNDGSQLDAYAKLGLKTVGVDPAINLVPLAEAKGHCVVGTYWDDACARGLLSGNWGPFDIITAQNVFAHTHDVLGFLDACKLVMKDDTLLFIQTSQSEMFERNEFDTMYHEHLSFFNVRSMQTLVERAGLNLDGVHKTNIHGTSYVFVISKNGIYKSNTVDNEYQLEELNGLYSFEKYKRFAKAAKVCTEDFKKAVDAYRTQGNVVVGYGAAAKGMTVLNFGGITLDYIIDDNPLKQGLLTPGTDIPIYGREKLLEDPRPKVFVPLAWNFFDEIARKINDITGTQNKFIRYFPTLQEVII